MDKKEMTASKDVVLKQDAAADEEKVSEQKTVKKELCRRYLAVSGV